MDKKLYRSTGNKMIAGVCAGVANYLNVDVTVVRLLWAVVSLFAGAGILAYLLAWFIIPEDNIIEG
ncbi:MAG: PspC domain-containing protein [Lachnospiraceae bacterium]|nr:PspC domain-containing protein [Lachnospiraceae bacterium]